MRAVTRSTPEADAASDDLAGESSRSRDEKKALQRKHILEAARDVFFRDGFVHANLDEVAQRAGVAKGTLYRYFDNKGELYVAVLVHNGAIFEQRMREAAASAHEPAEQIRRLGRFYYEHWTSHPEYFRIFWALENQEVIGELPQAVVAEVTKLWEECLRILADVVRAGTQRGTFRPCDEWVMANVLWTASNGLIQNEMVPSRRVTLHGHRPPEVFDAMVELVIAGMRA
jgi:TetR/AcrR family transcriptional regulator